MPKENFYYPELDGLRFFAFLFVFIHHAPVLLNNPFITIFHDYGWIGVDLFLCLSAFLFAKLLYIEYQSKGNINIKNFYIRRALRIWPLYFLFVGAMLVLTLKRMGWHADFLARIIGTLTFTDNLFSAALGYNLFVASAHLWTISYEEQFYAVIPWLLQKIFKLGHEKKAAVIASIFIAFTLTRSALIYFNFPHPAVWVLPVTHFESILGGLAIGLGLFDTLFEKTSKWLLIFLGISSITIVCVLPNVDVIGWRLMLTYPLTGLGVSLILASVIKKKSTFLQNQWLTYLGKISYGLYVYHLIAIESGINLARLLKISSERVIVHPFFVFAAALCITILVAVASYQWLEKPFLRMKERFTSIQSRPI